MAAEDSQYDISRYDYELPPESIAQRPAEPRDASRLMVLHRADGKIEHAVFRDLGRFLRAGDLLVLNNTRVFPARTIGTRSTGGKVEVFFLRDLGQGLWEAMIRAHGKPKSGEYLQLEDGRLVVKLAEKTATGQWTVLVPRAADLLKTLQEVGRTPLPPYVRRGEDRSLETFDHERYQTVYARQTGAVAAPTAGLHFTEALLRALRERGVGTAEITLHVGLGTFQPIKVDDVRRHRMHAEFFSIDAAGSGADRRGEARRRTRHRGRHDLLPGAGDGRRVAAGLRAVPGRIAAVRLSAVRVQDDRRAADEFSPAALDAPPARRGLCRPRANPRRVRGGAAVGLSVL